MSRMLAEAVRSPAMPEVAAGGALRRWAWLTWAASSGLFLVVNLAIMPAAFVDTSVYRAESLALWEGADLYGPLPGVHGLATYPPFGAAVLLPLAVIPSVAADLVSLLLNVALLLVAAHLSVRRIPSARRHVHAAAPALAGLALWCEPVLQNGRLGQINLLLLCLVLWDFSLPERSRWRGLGIGVAAAIKVTPGIFIVYLLVTRRFRAAAVAIATLVGTVAASALVAPQATWDFWTHHVFDTSRVGRLENSVNQSVLGLLVRAAQSNEPGPWATVVALVVVALGMAAAAYCYRRLGDRWALLVAAVTGLLASPISWSHHWVWCVPLVALAYYEARALLLPALAVFWTHAVWWVPHGNAVELHLTPLQVASSAWYAVVAVGFIGYAMVRARGVRPSPQMEDARTPALLADDRGSRCAAGRADRI